MELKGQVHKFGDDVNTDEIIPARYLNTSDPMELAKHAMEDADPEFVNKMKPGISSWPEKFRLRLLPGTRPHRPQGARASPG